MITSHRPHQTPHINPLLLIALGTVIIVMFAVITSVKAPVTPFNREQAIVDTRPRFPYPAAAADEFPAYHQSEWGEAAAPVIGAKGLDLYQQSERTLIPANAGLTTYHLSERTMIPANAGLVQYQAGERMYVPYQSGLEQYHASERTQVVINLDPNDPLYLYHLSEWYGK